MKKDLITKTIWVLGGMHLLCKYNRNKINDLRKVLDVKIDIHNSQKGVTKLYITDEELESIIEEFFNNGVIGRGNEGEYDVFLFHDCKDEIGMPAGFFNIIRNEEKVSQVLNV